LKNPTDLFLRAEDSPELLSRCVHHCTEHLPVMSAEFWPAIACLIGVFRLMVAKLDLR
jgi:hypothetical protein